MSMPSFFTHSPAAEIVTPLESNAGRTDSRTDSADFGKGHRDDTSHRCVDCSTKRAVIIHDDAELCCGCYVFRRDEDAFVDMSLDAMRPATFTYRRHEDVVAEIGREARATGISFRTLLAGSR